MTLLSREQCSAMRGLAIMGIFMHNYLHWLGPMVKENEYQFIQHNVDRMMVELSSPSGNLIYHLFSFFGHYGVPIFLFLSGYGLVKKYENQSLPAFSGFGSGAFSFVKHHFMKLFPMMLLGFVVFAMVDWVTPGHHHWAWTELLGMLTMTVNFFPDPDHAIWPGPYWFFGLMMQLYIIYRLIMYKRHWGWTMALIVICTIAQAFCYGNPEGNTLNWLRYNCIGGMLPFGLGVLMARVENDNSMKPFYTRGALLLMFFLSLLFVLLFSLNFWLWLFVPVFIVLLHVSFVKLLPKLCLRPVIWLGALSAAIFVAHPVTRKIFIPISRGGDIFDGLLLYIIATLMLSMMYKMVINRINH